MSVRERVQKISQNTNLNINTPFTTAKVELTGCGTLGCWFCDHLSMKKNNIRQHMMSQEDFEIALEYLKRFDSLREVGLFYMGESGLHPLLDRYYRCLKKAGYFTFLTTNATVITNILKAIPYIDSLKVSWNYKNEDDFNHNFSLGVGQYNTIIENVKILKAECNKFGKPLAISTVLDTCKEDYTDSLSELVYDEHYWIPLQNQGGTQECGADGVIGEDSHKVSPLPCWSLFKGIYIDCDLNVRLCCYGHSNEHILGNLHNGIDSIKSNNDIKLKQLSMKVTSQCMHCLRQTTGNKR